jgi:hypothetical protein
MSIATALRMGALASTLLLATAACSSTRTTRLSSSSMCQAAGGTYSAGTCQPGGDIRTAQQMCAAHGGTYFAGGDYCEVNGGGWKN